MFEPGSKILFNGDSVTDCGRARPVGEGICGGLGNGYVAYVGAMLTCMYPEKHFRVVNVATAGHQCRGKDAVWQKEVLDQKPDYVALLIGINDVWRQFDVPELKEQHVTPEEFVESYERIITMTLPHVKGMILMMPYLMEPNRQDPMRARMDQYGAIVKKLAEKYGLICVDLQAGWDKLFEHMHPMSIAWDRVHPNQAGHMYIAKQFLAAVGFDR